MTKLRPWLLAIVVLLAVLLGVLVGPRLRRALGFEKTGPLVVISEIKRLKQLITVRCSIQRVIGIKEQKQPVGEESLLLMVQGEVQAGVDLAGLDPSAFHFSDRQTVVVILPPAQIVNVFLDEKHTKVWDRYITWWTPWVDYNPDLEHKARQQALEDVRAAAIEMGILQQAQKNAELTIHDFLEALHLSATVTAGVS